MTKSLALASTTATPGSTSCRGGASPIAVPTLFDAPNYDRSKLELTAETGRIPDEQSDAKGVRAIPVCEQHLVALFPHARVSCAPSFPLGWSATVPMKATVSERSGSVKKFFLKFCDDDAGILEQVKKEFIWQQALWTNGVTATPQPILFDRSRRLFISSQAEGVSAAKSLFDAPEYRQQVADVLAHIHVLKLEPLPGDSHLFLRPVQSAIDDGLQKGQLDPQIAQGISAYARDVEAAILRRYEPETMARAVHGDMKAGNMLVQTDKRVLTFTDFGMAHRGDPASDVGFFLADVHRPIDDVRSFVGQYGGDKGTDTKLFERAMLHTAYNRLERYVRYQDWYAHDAGAKSTMAALVQQDHAAISSLLR